MNDENQNPDGSGANVTSEPQIGQDRIDREADLQAELAELREENTRLKAAQAAPTESGVKPTDAVASNVGVAGTVF